MRTAGSSSVAIVAVCTAFGQPPPPPAFEVASIKLYRLPANTFIAPPEPATECLRGWRKTTCRCRWR